MYRFVGRVIETKGDKVIVKTREGFEVVARVADAGDTIPPSSGPAHDSERLATALRRALEIRLPPGRYELGQTVEFEMPFPPAQPGSAWRVAFWLVLLLGFVFIYIALKG